MLPVKGARIFSVRCLVDMPPPLHAGNKQASVSLKRVYLAESSATSEGIGSDCSCLPVSLPNMDTFPFQSKISPDLEPKILIANRKEEARGEKANGVTVSSLSGFPQPRSFGTSPAAINHANGRTGFASGESLLRKENRPFRLCSQSRGQGFFLHVVVDKLGIFSGARHPSLDVTSNRLSCVCRCKSGCELQKPANV